MISLFFTLIAVLIMAMAFGLCSYFLKFTCKHYGKYIAFLIIMFLWFDMLIGFKGATAMIIVGLIPLSVGIFIMRHPTK